MRLCQLIYVGEVELVGDLLEFAYLLVSKSILNKNAGNRPSIGFLFFFRR